MKLKVLYVFSRRSRAEQERLLEGHDSPDDLLYGYRALNSEHFFLTYICRYQDEGGVLRWIWFPFEYVVARLLKMGFSLHTALENIGKLNRADVIVCTVDVIGLPIALLKRMRLVRTPMIYISQGLSDRLEVLASRSLVRRFFQMGYGWLLRPIERVLVLGEGVVLPMQKLFALDPDRVSAIAFGVDCAFWQPGSGRIGDYIFSIGSDMARDYETLLRATGGEPVHIVTRLSVRPRPGVQVSTNHTDAELRDLYRRARVVVIPLKNVAQPSGQSATLQAMACGQAVILTRTRGLWEPRIMRHKENCYLVEPGDVAGMRAALDWFRQYPEKAARIGQAARRTVEQKYTSRQLAGEIKQQINAAISSNK